MTNLIKQLKIFIQKLKDRRSTRIPDGMTAHNEWVQSLIDTYGFPNNDSVRFTFASMILQLGQLDAYKPKRDFALAGLAAASKEVALARMQELKAANDAKLAAEKAANTPPPFPATEVTAQKSGNSNVTPIKPISN